MKFLFPILFLLFLPAIPGVAAEDYQQYQFSPRPAPDWVQMIDQGARNPQLAGLVTPEGIRVELFATEPAVVDPVGMAFGPAGTPYVLEWRQAPEKINSHYEFTYQDGAPGKVERIFKATPDQLKELLDVNQDGVYETARVLMDDLQCPSSLMIDDGWFYLPSNGWVIRRRQSKPGGPFDIEEEIVRGLCGFDHHQSSGVTLSQDGWLFVPAGDNDNRGEGSDGSRATVLRTGAIFRLQPDGSRLQEYARGFRNPYRDVQFDHFGNMFHVDNDQEDGSKFQGVRLMHVPEAADFGWRLYPGAICCQTDFVRGAVFGEKPGKMPAMLKTGRGAPAGLAIYQGTAFPEFFRGLLIYPDVYRKLVRAYEVEKYQSTFRVVREFVLMESQDDLFRPCQALVGPDGAIYIVDWRTPSGGAGRVWGDNVHGRIYRLSWAGNAAAPAIEPGAIDAWKRLAHAENSALWEILRTTEDYQLRRRAQRVLVRRGPAQLEAFIQLALDVRAQPAARAAALGGAAQLYQPAVTRALLTVLSDAHPELRRLTCETLSRNVPASEVDATLIGSLLARLSDPEPSVCRAAALACGQLARYLPEASALRQQAVVGISFALQHADRSDPYLFDGLLRGLERLDLAGLGPLVTWLKSSDPELQDRATFCVQSLRTRAGATLLDSLFDQNLLAGLSPALQGRLVSSYRNILVDPPVQAKAVTSWLASQTDLAVEVQLACMETLGAVPGGDLQVMGQLAAELLTQDDLEIRLAVIRSIGDTDLKILCPQLAAALLDQSKPAIERETILKALAKLRSYEMWPRGRTAPGVELVLGELKSVAQHDPDTNIRSRALQLLAEVDFQTALPTAQLMLKSGNLPAQETAVRMLGAQQEYALQLAQQFIAGELDRQLLPQIAEVLRRHLPRDKTGEIAQLLKQVFQGGLLVKLTPEEIARVEQIVKSTGNPEQGRRLFFDRRSQCAQCHQIERRGKQVGPDLTKIWDTHTVGKIMESILDPSREIKEGYATWTIVTDEGLVHQGLKIKENDQETILRDATGRELRILADTIEEKVESKTSLMPAGVVSQLTYPEFIDLVAFLKSKQAQQQLRDEPQGKSIPQ